MTAFVHALLHFIWEGTVVALALSLALALLRNRSASVRYIVSCCALGIMAILPAVTMYVDFAEPPSHFELPLAAGIANIERPAYEQWVLAIWSLGVLALSGRLVWGCRQAARLRRSGQGADECVVALVAKVAARMGVTRPIVVIAATAAKIPGVVGWLRPAILLPVATLAQLSTSQLESVLAHELAHIRRYDYLVNLAQMLIETLLFYHPAVWWVSSRIRHERELCCDDLAVEMCGDAAGYARALTELARIELGNPAVAATGGSLLFRVRRLMGVASPEHSPSRWPAVLAICAALVCIASTVNWVNAQQPTPAPKPEPQVAKPTPAPKAQTAPQPAAPPKAAAPKRTPEPQPTFEFLRQQVEEKRREAEDLRRAAQESEFEAREAMRRVEDMRIRAERAQAEVSELMARVERAQRAAGIEERRAASREEQERMLEDLRNRVRELEEVLRDNPKLGR